MNRNETGNKQKPESNVKKPQEKALKKERINIPEEFQRLDIYKFFAYFLVSAFVGWIWETIVVWGMTGQWTDRGFLFIMKPLGHYFPALQSMAGLAAVPLIWGLPIIGIYGMGGLLVCGVFKRWRRHPVELFLIGMVSLTLLELFSSYLCDWLLHRKYWDYTGHLLSFQGRICLYSALSWGTLTVLGVAIVVPWIDRLYMCVGSKRCFQWSVTLLMLYAGICAVVKYAIDPTIIAN